MGNIVKLLGSGPENGPLELGFGVGSSSAGRNMAINWSRVGFVFAMAGLAIEKETGESSLQLPDLNTI